jgi:predicted glutamine amidotransferase
VGCAGDLSYRDKDILEMMLVFSTVRGRDSTGVAFIPRLPTGDVRIVKDIGNPFDLYDRKSYDIITAGTTKAMIGHTRKATVGNITKQTAHPFNYGTFSGVHNGTLRNYYKLPGGETGAIDSQRLYSSFAEIGVRDTIEQVEGAYALVWHDTADDTLNFLRNDQRTLFYAFSEDYRKVFWASETWMITVACGKHGQKLANQAGKDEPEFFVAPLETDSWWSVTIDPLDKKNVFTFVRNEKLEGGVAIKSAVNFHNPYRSPWGWEDNLDDDPNIPGEKGDVGNAVKALPQNPQVITPTAVESKSTAQSPLAGESEKDKIVSQAVIRAKKPLLSLAHDSKRNGSEVSRALPQKFDNELLDFRGDVIDAGEYAKTDQCCSFCQKDVDYNDALTGSIGKWLSTSALLCSTCFTNNANKELAA